MGIWPADDKQKFMFRLEPDSAGVNLKLLEHSVTFNVKIMAFPLLLKEVLKMTFLGVFKS